MTLTKSPLDLWATYGSKVVKLSFGPETLRIEREADIATEDAGDAMPPDADDQSPGP